MFSQPCKHLRMVKAISERREWRFNRGPQPLRAPGDARQSKSKSHSTRWDLQSLTMSDGFDFNGLGDPLFRSRLYRFPADFGFEEGVD